MYCILLTLPDISTLKHGKRETHLADDFSDNHGKDWQGSRSLGKNVVDRKTDPVSVRIHSSFASALTRRRGQHGSRDCCEESKSAHVDVNCLDEIN